MKDETELWLETRAGYFFFKDWRMPNPLDKRLIEAMWRMRYASPSRDDCFRVLSAAEAYCHLASHPASNKLILKQLRELRAAVKEERKNRVYDISSEEGVFV